MLNHPYPVSSSAVVWRTTLFVGLFITLFLLVFQPFGLTAYHAPNKYWFIAGYGLVTIGVLSIDNLLIKAYSYTKSGKSTWTVKKQMVMQVLVLFTIGAGNYFYSAWHFHFENPIIGFLIFQFFTTAVGLIPIGIITIMNENIRNKTYLKEASLLNQSVPALHQVETIENPVFLTGENNSKPLEIPVSNFLFAESSGNYLDVHFVKEGKVKSVLLRTTLLRAESQLEHHNGIMKCHRAFLVNCEHIVQVKGNAQGLRLQLQHTNDEIPVSRNYIKDLRSKLDA